MWTPTHVQVTVQQARNLIPKGKGGTNDAYVTIQLGKEKYQTSVKEKADQPAWLEECDLPIPLDKKDAVVLLGVYHRSFLKLDEFLGHLSLPLGEFPIYERPHSKWYALKGRPGKKGGSQKYRGEIEVKVTFIVQSKSSSEINLSRVGRDKRLGSLKSLQNLGDKLKLPTRSNSFGKNEKKASVASPLVAGNDNTPTVGARDSPEPVFKTMPMRPAGNLENARRFSMSSSRLDEVNIFKMDLGSERSVDVDPKDKEVKLAVPDIKETREVSPTPPRRSPKINHHLERVKLSDFTHEPPSRNPFEDEEEEKPERPRAAKREGFDIARLPWSPDDSPKTTGAEDFKRLDRTRQPILRSSGRRKQRPMSLDDQLDGAPPSVSSAEAQDTPLLTNVPEKSASQDISLPRMTEDDTYSSSPSPDWRETRKERLGSGKSVRSSHSIPESIPEDKEPETPTDLVPRVEKERLLDVKNSTRRHTMHTDVDIKPATTHALHRSFIQSQNSRDESLPPEVLEHFDDFTKEVNTVAPKKPARAPPPPPPPEELPEPEKQREELNPKVAEKEQVERKEKDDMVKSDAVFGMTIIPTEPSENEEEFVKEPESMLPPDVIAEYGSCSREDLIRLVLTQKDQLAKKDTYVRDLEVYIDNLLVRVISCTPKLLQNPFQSNNSANSTPNRTSVNDMNNRNMQQSVITNKQPISVTCTPTKRNTNPFMMSPPTRN